MAEETRGGDSLAAPLRKLGIFPKTVVQMISVGEESGTLPEMLLKVADIEERHMRALISDGEKHRRRCGASSLASDARVVETLTGRLGTARLIPGHASRSSAAAVRRAD